MILELATAAKFIVGALLGAGGMWKLLHSREVRLTKKEEAEIRRKEIILLAEIEAKKYEREVREQKERDQILERIKRTEASAVLDRKMAVRSHLDKIRSKTSADRVAIVRLDDSNLLLTVGSLLYISIVSESFADGLDSIITDWNRQLIDDAHAEVLRALMQKKQLHVFERDLKNGIVKRAAKIHKVQAIRYIEIVQPAGLFFYLMMEFPHDNLIPDIEEEIVRISGNAIKIIYKDDFQDSLMTDVVPISAPATIEKLKLPTI